MTDTWKPSRGWKHYALWLEGKHEEMTRRWLMAHECITEIEREVDADAAVISAGGDGDGSGDGGKS